MQRTEPEIIDRLVSWNDQLEGRTPNHINLIVLHCTELPSLEHARRVAERSSTDPEGRCVAGHYYVDRDGRIYRFVEDLRIANHVRGHNRESFGIELINRGRYPHWFSSRHQTPTEEYPQEQVAAVIDLITYLSGLYPALESIARHSDLDQRLVPAEDDPSTMVRRRIDPGPLFPWERILELWRHLRRDVKAVGGTGG